MTILDTKQTVGQLVRECPSRARVFESLSIDYCCGGKVPLELACEKRGVDVADVLKKLEASDATNEPADVVDADTMTLTELADPLEATHHAYFKVELAR